MFKKSNSSGKSSFAVALLVGFIFFPLSLLAFVGVMFITAMVNKDLRRQYFSDEVINKLEDGLYDDEDHEVIDAEDDEDAHSDHKDSDV